MGYIYESLHMEDLNSDAQETVIALLTSNSREEQAKTLGISRQALYKRLVNHPEIEEFLACLKKVANQTLVLASIKAAEKLASHIDHNNPKISMKASIEILDRIGATSETHDVPVVRDMKVLIEEEKQSYAIG